MPDVRYVLPFDRLDLTYLDLYVQKPRTRNLLWTRGDLNGETTYQHVEILCKEYQGEEPPDSYICHICNVQVPEMYLKEHNESQKHKNYQILTEIALENQSKQTYINIANIPVDNDNNKFYCETCSEIVCKNDEIEHIVTEEHLKSKENDKLADDFLTMYIVNRNILTEKQRNKTTAKRYLGNDDCSNDAAGLEEQELIECDSEEELFIKDTGQYCLIRSIASKFFKPSEDLVPEQDQTEPEIDEQNPCQVPSVENTEIREFEQYLQDVVVKKHKLNFNLLVLDDSIVLITSRGYRKKITVDMFHSFRRIDDTVFCQLCQVWICQTKVHCYTSSHVKHVTRPVNDNFARKINNTWSHCVVCNERILTGSNHAAVNSYHLNQVDSSEQNERSIELDKVTKQTFCYTCSRHVATNNVATHIKDKEHVNNYKIPDKKPDNEICVHYSKLDYDFKNKFDVSDRHANKPGRDSVFGLKNGKTNIYNSNIQLVKDNMNLELSNCPDVENRFLASVLHSVYVDSKPECVVYNSELERANSEPKNDTNIHNSNIQCAKDNTSMEHSNENAETENLIQDSKSDPVNIDSKSKSVTNDSKLERNNETNIHNSNIQYAKDNPNLEHSKDNPKIENVIQVSKTDSVNVDSKSKCVTNDSDLERKNGDTKIQNTNIQFANDNPNLEHSFNSKIENRIQDSKSDLICVDSKSECASNDSKLVPNLGDSNMQYADDNPTLEHSNDNPDIENRILGSKLYRIIVNSKSECATNDLKLKHNNGNYKSDTNIHVSNIQYVKDKPNLEHSNDKPDIESEILDSKLDRVNVDSKSECITKDSDSERNNDDSKNDTDIHDSKFEDNLSLEHSGCPEIVIRSHDSVSVPNRVNSKDETCIKNYKISKTESILHNTKLEQNNNDSNFEHNGNSQHETRILDSKSGSDNDCSTHVNSIENSESGLYSAVNKYTFENNLNLERGETELKTHHSTTESDIEENDVSSDLSKISDSEYENTNSSDYSYIVSKPMTTSARFYSYCKQFTYIDKNEVNCDVCNVKIVNKKKSIICHVENVTHKEAVKKLLSENNIILTSHMPLYYCAFCDTLLECFLDHLEDANHLSWIHLSDKISKRKLKYKADEKPRIAEFRQKYKTLLVYNYVTPRGRSSYCEACGVKLARYTETEHIYTKDHKSKLISYLRILRE